MPGASVDDSFMKTSGGFLSHRATPSHHPNFNGGFQYRPSICIHFWGSPMTVETPKLLSSRSKSQQALHLSIHGVQSSRQQVLPNPSIPKVGESFDRFTPLTGNVAGKSPIDRMCDPFQCPVYLGLAMVALSSLRV